MHNNTFIKHSSAPPYEPIGGNSLQRLKYMNGSLMPLVTFHREGAAVRQQLNRQIVLNGFSTKADAMHAVCNSAPT